MSGGEPPDPACGIEARGALALPGRSGAVGSNKGELSLGRFHSLDGARKGEITVEGSANSREIKSNISSSVVLVRAGTMVMTTRNAELIRTARSRVTPRSWRR